MLFFKLVYSELSCYFLLWYFLRKYGRFEGLGKKEKNERVLEDRIFFEGSCWGGFKCCERG